MNEGRDHRNSLEVRKIQHSHREIDARFAPLRRRRTSRSKSFRPDAHRRGVLARWTGNAPCSRRWPRYRSGMALSPSGCMHYSSCYGFQLMQCRLIFQGAQKSRRHMLRSSSASNRNSTEATCGRLHSRHVAYRGRRGKDRCRTSTGTCPRACASADSATTANRLLSIQLARTPTSS